MMPKDASSYDIIDFWSSVDALSEYAGDELIADDFQVQIEEYLNNADEIPFLTFSELVTVLKGVCKLCKVLTEQIPE